MVLGIGSVMDGRPLIVEEMQTGMPVFSISLDSFFGRLAYNVFGLLGMHVMDVPDNYDKAMRRKMTLLQPKGTPHPASNSVTFGYTPMFPDGIFGRRNQQAEPQRPTGLRAFRASEYESDTFHSEALSALPAAYQRLRERQGAYDIETFDGRFIYKGVEYDGYRLPNKIYLNTKGDKAEVRARLVHELFEDPNLPHNEVGRRAYNWADINDPEAAVYVARHNIHLD